MQWLNDLLGVKAPPGTSFRSAELVFRGLFPWPLAVLLLVLLGAGVIALYCTERGRIGVVRRTLMATLRIAILTLLLLLIFRPLLLSEFEGQRSQPVLLLVDNSQSMKQQDKRLGLPDRLRVAIAQELLAPQTKVQGPEAPTTVPANTPKDPPRIDIVRAVLANSRLKLVEGLRKHGPVRGYLFGQDVHGEKESAAKSDKTSGGFLAGFDAHEPRTALADAVSGLLQRKDGELPAAIVVITDGRDNASKLTLEEAASECARLRVPLHIYGVGSSEAGSLQIKDVAVADTIFFDDLVAVPIRWRAQGFKKGTVQLTLTLGFQLTDKSLDSLRKAGVPQNVLSKLALLIGKQFDTQESLSRELAERLPRDAVERFQALVLKHAGKVVAEKEVPVKAGEDLREVLTFTPPKGKQREEKMDLVATVKLKENDAFRDGMTRPLRVIDSKVKVLYVENSPRWEYKFLMPALLRDRRIDAKFLLVNADPETLKVPGSLNAEQRARWPYLQKFPDRDQLLGYDLLILGDVSTAGPKGFLKTPELEHIREFVEKFRGGLLLLAGRQHMPAEYRDTPLAEVLPVEFLPQKFKADVEKRTQPFVPVLTDAGMRSDALALADTPDENLKTWTGLPGFHWHYPVTKLRPGATSLLAHPRAKMGEQPMPLLATQFFGRGQVFFMASDETWRWRFNAQDKHFGRFWGQLIYQAGLPHMLGGNAGRVQLALERSEAVLGRPGQVYARLLDSKFRPLNDKRIAATLHALDAKPGQPRERPIQLEHIEGREGEYRALLPHDVPGRFEIKVNDPKLADAQPSPFAYRVNLPPHHELEEAGMAEDALREAARVSGGRFYQEEDLYRLADDVQPRKQSYTLRQEVLLWNWLTFLLFLLLITAEWVLRKFSNLS